MYDLKAEEKELSSLYDQWQTLYLNGSGPTGRKLNEIREQILSYKEKLQEDPFRKSFPKSFYRDNPGKENERYTPDENIPFFAKILYIKLCHEENFVYISNHLNEIDEDKESAENFRQARAEIKRLQTACREENFDEMKECLNNEDKIKKLLKTAADAIKSNTKTEPEQLWLRLPYAD